MGYVIIELMDEFSDAYNVHAWAVGVKSRDCWVCQDCGELDKELLEAHHIKPKSKFPDLAEDIGNGRALCMLCHIRAHSGEPLSQIPILLRYLRVLMGRCNWPKLTYRQREAFRLVYIQGCSAAEASRLMGCSRANVNQLLGKIKKIYPALFTEKGGLRLLRLPASYENQTKQVF